MKKYACDICKAEVDSEYKLNRLVDNVQVDGINDLCDDCIKEIKEVYSKVEKIVHKVKVSWIKSFISKFIKSKNRKESNVKAN